VKRHCYSRATGLTSIPQVSPAEIQEIVASYADTGKPGDKGHVKRVQSNGFKVAGTKYMTIKADEKSLYGKKVRAGPAAVA